MVSTTLRDEAAGMLTGAAIRAVAGAEVAAGSAVEVLLAGSRGDDAHPTSRRLVKSASVDRVFRMI